MLPPITMARSRCLATASIVPLFIALEIAGA